MGTNATGHLPQLAELVAMDQPLAVRAEVETTIQMAYPGFDTGRVHEVFGHILALFDGRVPGYRPCNTEYHNLQHTTDAFIAMARLIHGAVVEGNSFSEKNVELALIATILHDVGYIQQEGDVGSGAKYTQNHIDRSADFLSDHLRAKGFDEFAIADGRDMLACTGFTVRIQDIRFRSFESRILGMMLGSADLLGQMADRAYLEKISLLYREFKEAKIPGIAEEIDLYLNTLSFYELTQKRFANDLGGVNHFMRSHFRARWGVDADLYAVSIERQMNYLREILEHFRPDYRKHLRRWRPIQKKDTRQ